MSSTHSAWSCTDRECAAHPASLYGPVPREECGHCGGAFMAWDERAEVARIAGPADHLVTHVECYFANTDNYALA